MTQMQKINSLFKSPPQMRAPQPTVASLRARIELRGGWYHLPMSSVEFCTRCGVAVDEEVNKCPRCGSCKFAGKPPLRKRARRSR